MHRKHVKATIPLFLLVMQPDRSLAVVDQQFLDIQVVDEQGNFLSHDYHNAHKIHLDIRNSRKQHKISKRDIETNTAILSSSNPISFTETYLRNLYNQHNSNNQHEINNTSSSKHRHKRSSIFFDSKSSNTSSSNQPMFDTETTIYLNMTLFGEKHTAIFKYTFLKSSNSKSKS